jgi:uncharacterized protein involved in propanediol utilization
MHLVAIAKRVSKNVLQLQLRLRHHYQTRQHNFVQPRKCYDRGHFLTNSGVVSPEVEPQHLHKAWQNMDMEYVALSVINSHLTLQSQIPASKASRR